MNWKLMLALIAGLSVWLLLGATWQQSHDHKLEPVWGILIALLVYAALGVITRMVSAYRRWYFKA